MLERILKKLSRPGIIVVGPENDTFLVLSGAHSPSSPELNDVRDEEDRRDKATYDREARRGEEKDSEVADAKSESVEFRPELMCSSMRIVGFLLASTSSRLSRGREIDRRKLSFCVFSAEGRIDKPFLSLLVNDRASAML